MVQNQRKIDSEGSLEFDPVFASILEAILEVFWCQNGVKLGANWKAKWKMLKMQKPSKTNGFLLILLFRAVHVPEFLKEKASLERGQTEAVILA